MRPSAWRRRLSVSGLYLAATLSLACPSVTIDATRTTPTWACVADLRDGAMAWCTSLQDDVGDLADPGRVLVAIHAMLKGLFVRVPPGS